MPSKNRNPNVYRFTAEDKRELSELAYQHDRTFNGEVKYALGEYVRANTIQPSTRVNLIDLFRAADVVDINDCEMDRVDVNVGTGEIFVRNFTDKVIVFKNKHVMIDGYGEVNTQCEDGKMHKLRFTMYRPVNQNDIVELLNNSVRVVSPR